ncbi:MAG: dTDP-4-amino-4,6-dideoxy-D-glucose aminotransferase VioA [Roseivirga sp.]
MIKGNRKSSIMKEEKVYVTSPSLPPLDEYVASLRKIWDSKYLTNMGPFHHEFEDKLSSYLGVEHLSLFSNGTLALLTALQVLEVKGEVITTPYTFVATAHALIWNNLTPVFCDIDPDYGNINPDKIEALIGPKTSAILPVHVYGNPAQHEKIGLLAKKHSLKVVYDAAHAFGVTEHEQSVLNYGDLSIVSFHATKAFNTIEGGAIISHSAEMKRQIDYLKNFGFEDETTVIRPGINAKMNELQAAYGILQLDRFQDDVRKRKEVSLFYKKALSNVTGVRLLPEMNDVVLNHAYFPIFIEQDYPLTRDELYEKLKSGNIFSRRYFYPLASNLSCYERLPSAEKNKLPIANKLADTVLCLPISSHLEVDTLEYIVSLIR